MKIICLILLALYGCSPKNNKPTEALKTETNHWTRVYYKDSVIDNQKVNYSELLIYDKKDVILNFYDFKDSLVKNISYDIINKQYFEGLNVNYGITNGVNFWVDIDSIQHLVKLTFWQNFEKDDTIIYYFTKNNKVMKEIKFCEYPSQRLSFEYSDFYYSKSKKSIDLDYIVFIKYKSKKYGERFYTTDFSLGDSPYLGVNDLKKDLMIRN